MKATWYPASVCVVIHDDPGRNTTLYAPTWNDAVEIAKEFDVTELADVLGRFVWNSD